jgi:Fe-S-cluster-containing dehydrogenase component
MSTDRRQFLGGLAGAAAGAAACSLPSTARASEKIEPPEAAVAMLYDTTLCIGCKACVVACRESNGDPPVVRDGMHDAPMSLDAKTRNIIQLAVDEKDNPISYMKKQCMHCVDPACAAACMIGALSKDEQGVVSWEGSRCVGCRYCQIGCPYNIVKFEWESANPEIIKCEFCQHKLAEGGIPACCEVCPREAVIYGPREQLLAEAKRRIADDPDRYVNKVYGEHDAGGTQVFYLSHVPFEDIGLPDLGEKSTPETVRNVQHTIYKGFVAPVALYVTLGFVMMRNRRVNEARANADSAND